MKCFSHWRVPQSHWTRLETERVSESVSKRTPMNRRWNVLFACDAGYGFKLQWDECLYANINTTWWTNVTRVSWRWQWTQIKHTVAVEWHWVGLVKLLISWGSYTGVILKRYQREKREKVMQITKLQSQEQNVSGYWEWREREETEREGESGHWHRVTIASRWGWHGGQLKAIWIKWTAGSEWTSVDSVALMTKRIQAM